MAEEEGGGSGPYAPGFLRPGRERHREREKEEGKKVVEGGGGGQRWSASIHKQRSKASENDWK